MMSGKKSPITFMGQPVYAANNTSLSGRTWLDFFFVEKGILVRHCNLDIDGGIANVEDDELPAAILCKINGKTELVIDADGARSTDSHGLEGISTSFSCISHLLHREINAYIRARIDAIEDFASGKLKILDATDDSTIKASSALLKEWKKIKSQVYVYPSWLMSQKPTEAGYTLIERSTSIEWHKSATVLVGVTKTSKRAQRTFLLGQDDGTYFGVELADNPKTIADAYLSLMPKEIRGKKGVIRQGEWYAVPCPEKEVPNMTDEDCLCFIDSKGNDAVTFPVETRDSNRHYLSGEVIITKKGKLFAKNFTLSHLGENNDSQHPELKGVDKQWYWFIRNTAKASYSVENAD
jgi:hypothetical protein